MDPEDKTITQLLSTLATTQILSELDEFIDLSNNDDESLIVQKIFEDGTDYIEFTTECTHEKKHWIAPIHDEKIDVILPRWGDLMLNLSSRFVIRSLEDKLNDEVGVQKLRDALDSNTTLAVTLEEPLADDTIYISCIDTDEKLKHKCTCKINDNVCTCNNKLHYDKDMYYNIQDDVTLTIGKGEDTDEWDIIIDTDDKTIHIML